jgi:imidazolonepropionase-like amidohydrolase
VLKNDKASSGGSRWKLQRAVRKNALFVLLGLALIATLYLVNTKKQATVANGRIAIVGARLIDMTGREIIEDSILIIGDDKIEAVGRRRDLAVPRGARVIEATGCTVLPGLIDCDVHLITGSGGSALSVSEFMPERITRDLQASLYWGITALRDGGDSLNISSRYRDRLKDDGGTHPRFYVSGAWITARGGYPALYLPPLVASDVTRQIAGQPDLKGAIDELADKNVDMLDIAYEGGSDWKPYPKLPLSILKEVVELAHAKGLRVSALTRSNLELKEALQAGVNAVEHISAERIDEECIKLLLEKQAYYCPSLALRYSEAASRDETDALLATGDVRNTVGPRILESLLQHKGYFFEVKEDNMGFGYMQEVWKNSQASLRMVSERGVKVILGTGAGSPVVFHGLAPHDELRLMLSAGLPAMEALKSATKTAAEFIGIDKQVGTLEVGKQADILILEGNPLDDIAATKRIRAVLRDGVEVDRGALLQPPSGAEQP